MITKPITLVPKPDSKIAMQWQGDNEASIREFVGTQNIRARDDRSLEVWNSHDRSWVICPVHAYIVAGRVGQFYVLHEELVIRNFNIEGVEDLTEKID